MVLHVIGVNQTKAPKVSNSLRIDSETCAQVGIAFVSAAHSVV